jgi:hypothetical protein
MIEILIVVNSNYILEWDFSFALPSGTRSFTLLKMTEGWSFYLSSYEILGEDKLTH